MIALSVVIRRALVVAGVGGVLVLGALSVRAAGAWTAAAAPLTVPPATVAELQDRLATEQARSDALEADVVTLRDQVSQLRGALDAANAQLGTDTTTASQLQDRMAAARDRLAKLETLVAKAERQLAATVAAARARAVAPAPATTSTGGSEEHDDD